MAGELWIERRYHPDRKRETRALLLLLGIGGAGIPTPRGERSSKDCHDVTKNAPPGEAAQ
jgi:hypothetical protein